MLQQDFANFEYLVKDGQSSDDTVARLKGMGVKNIHVSKDGGIYPAMNQALRLCRGRYVWYLNAGDTFASPGVLARFADEIQRHGFPAFVYGDLQTMGRHPLWETGPATGPREVRMRTRLTRFYLYRRTICQQAWAVARTLYEQCGMLDERFRLAADYDFLLKAILQLEVAYVHVPMVCITYAAGGYSERNLELAQRETQELLRKYFPAWERHANELLTQAARLIVHGRCFCRLHRRLPPSWQARLAGL